MAHTYKTFAAALTAPTQANHTAANDNKRPKPRKQPQPRYRGTLPALRWLYDNHPELAPAMAAAVKSLGATEWNTDATDNGLEIRPTIGELVRAASAGDGVDGKPVWLKPAIRDGKIELGDLRFDGNALTEYGRTRKGRKLEPRERMAARDNAKGGERNPAGYLWLNGAVAGPMDAEPIQRPFSGEPALAPMYSPQSGVEANRAMLREFGVDGSVPFDRLPFHSTKCRTAIANGAEFMGGVVGLSGTSSGGALMWESRHAPKGEVRSVVEAVASGATLKDIGERLGLKGGHMFRAAGDVVADAARVLLAANDNKRKKSAA